MNTSGTYNRTQSTFTMLHDMRSKLGRRMLTPAAMRGALTLLVLCSLVLIAHSAFAQTETVLYNFCSLLGTCRDGADPVSSVTPDGEGNFFGTTLNAGPNGGNVFELSPNGNGGFNEITLHAFTGGLDGSHPRSSVIFDGAGNLYGTTSNGGQYGYGVVFELTRSGSIWIETVLYSFANGADSGIPWSGVIMDKAGNLYGVTVGDTPNGFGAVFELSPSDSGWMEHVIYTLGPSSFFEPPSGLAMDAQGNIFGAVALTVFELSPNSDGGWNSNVIYTFPSGAYYSIDSTPAIDQQGNIFGTIQEEHKTKPGVAHVYKLTQTGDQWGVQILASWGKGTGPWGGVVLDSAGDVYGTTVGGGSTGDGTVFELRPKSNRYQKKVLWNFDGSNGETPFGSLVRDNAGNLYGTTVSGGTQGYGTVFEVTP
jgi:uncharacterized repeat protein (TIGR03803 family)